MGWEILMVCLPLGALKRSPNALHQRPHSMWQVARSGSMKGAPHSASAPTVCSRGQAVATMTVAVHISSKYAVSMVK